MEIKEIIQWIKTLFCGSPSDNDESTGIDSPNLANAPVDDNDTLQKPDVFIEPNETLFDDDSQITSDEQTVSPDVFNEQADNELKKIQEELMSEEMLNVRKKHSTNEVDNDEMSAIQIKEKELYKLAEDLDKQKLEVENQRKELQAQRENFEKEKSEFEEEKKQRENSFESDGTSLLENSAYMTFANYCCNMVTELERQQTDETADIIRYIRSQIVEGLIMSGAESINEDKEFNIMRHKPIGKGIVKKGTPIVSIDESGVAIGDTVLIKAKVLV